MKIEATKDDLSCIDNMKNSSSLDRWMRWKDTLNFNVGDILVKERNVSYRGDPHWEVEKASQRSTQPAKYIYLYKDDHGVGYIKKLSAGGLSTVGYPQSMFDLDLDRVRFKVDADYQDAILLGVEEGYDPAKAHLEEKKLRSEIREYNMKQVLKSKSTEDLIAWFRKSTSKKIWVGQDRTGDQFTEYTIGSVIDKQNYDGMAYKIVELFEEGGNMRPERIDYLQGSYIMFASRPKSIKDYK